MPQNSTRTARIEARIAPDVLETVRRAAELQGRSLSDFVVAAAQEAAQRTISDAHITKLSVADQLAFAQTLLEPPSPNGPLIEAARFYKARFAPKS